MRSALRRFYESSIFAEDSPIPDIERGNVDDEAVWGFRYNIPP
jgi:hypothetical protein